MFNIFKKKKKLIDPTERKPKTILCIPGNWDNRTEIVTSIATNNLNEFIFAGMILLNVKTNKGFELEICEIDDNIKNSFKWLGFINQPSDDFLNKLDKLKYVIYISAKTGNLDNAKNIAEAGNAILKSGGIGIKVETINKAFTKEDWNKLSSNFTEANMYEMFVRESRMDKQGIPYTYTCGMHNLGFKDSIVYDEELKLSIDLLSFFNLYQLIDNPEIQKGQTFSSDLKSPIFKITERKKGIYTGYDTFENPYGIWELKKASR